MLMICIYFDWCYLDKDEKEVIIILKLYIKMNFIIWKCILIKVKKDVCILLVI